MSLIPLEESLYDPALTCSESLACDSSLSCDERAVGVGLEMLPAVAETLGTWAPITKIMTPVAPQEGHWKSLYPKATVYPRQPQGMPIPLEGLTPGLYGGFLGMELPSFDPTPLALVALEES